MRATGQQVGQVRGGCQDLLEVVEQEQHVFLTERGFEQIEQEPRCSLFEIEALGDGGHDQGGVADGGERNEVDAIGKISEQHSGDLEGETSFAHATGASKREQANFGAAQEVLHGCDFLLSSEEWSKLDRQVVGVGVECLERRKISRQAGNDDLKEMAGLLL